MGAGATDPGERRRLGAPTATLVVVASMIGTGVFTTTGFLVRDLGSPLAVLAVWTAGYLEYNYTSPRYAQGDNANELGKLASITVYNAGAGYRIAGWDLALRINNLADESYAEFINSFGAVFPSPERNYMLTAGYRFE